MAGRRSIVTSTQLVFIGDPIQMTKNLFLATAAVGAMAFAGVAQAHTLYLPHCAVGGIDDLLTSIRSPAPDGTTSDQALNMAVRWWACIWSRKKLWVRPWLGTFSLATR